MSATDKITFRINKELKEDYKRAIDRDRSSKSMSADLCSYIDRKVKRSGILEEEK